MQGVWTSAHAAVCTHELLWAVVAVKDSNNMSSLAVAVFRGHADVVKHLIRTAKEQYVLAPMCFFSA